MRMLRVRTDEGSGRWRARSLSASRGACEKAGRATHSFSNTTRLGSSCGASTEGSGCTPRPAGAAQQLSPHTSPRLMSLRCAAVLGVHMHP